VEDVDGLTGVESTGLELEVEPVAESRRDVLLERSDEP
jgi:hypothetical protein